MKKEEGQTLVEFALAFPVLALVLFAIIQWALIFNAYLTLRHAAQVCSRTLSLSGAELNKSQTREIVCEAIESTMDCNHLDSVNAKPIQVGNDNTAAVEVEVEYELPLIIQFVVPNAEDNKLKLTAVAIDRDFN